DMALDWKKPLKELTLPNLIIAIQGNDPKAAEAFRSAFNALTLLIQRISDQNNDNRLLVERSLEHVGRMKKNVLGEATPRSDTYTPNGQKSNPAPGSRLLSKEA